MFRILIVDDEHLVLNGCRFMIQEILDIPFEVEVLLANNVPEAITLFEKDIVPDLALIDIRMPVMDGFALVKYIRQKHINTEMIILTSHSDFEYARTALRYQVSDFILKPIHEQTLQQLILKVYQKRMASFQEQKSTLCSKLLTMTLYSLSSTDLLIPDETLNMLFPHTYFTVIVANMEELVPDLDSCRQFLLNYYQECCCYYQQDRQQLICICNHEVFSVRPANLQEQFYQLLGTSFLLGISISSNSIKKLHYLYTNACQRIFYKKIFGSNEELINLVGFSYHNCIQIFTESNQQVVPDMLRDYFSRLQLIERPSPIYLKQIFTGFFQNISFYLENNGLKALSDEEMQAPHAISTKDELLHAIMNKMNQLRLRQTTAYNEITEDLIINQLLHYIHDHYKDDLSLDDLARAVDLHPNYISSYFKKITGESYLSCLHKERIQAAKQMLQNTDASIEEISRQVGYNSSSQFARIFRKYEGISPSSFKNK